MQIAQIYLSAIMWLIMPSICVKQKKTNKTK